jgi:hypothetical protein
MAYRVKLDPDQLQLLANVLDDRAENGGRVYGWGYAAEGH